VIKGWRLLVVLMFLTAAGMPVVPAMEVPRPQVITPGGDRYGYARVPRPYTTQEPERVTGLLLARDPVTGLGRRCGAVVLRSPGRDLVLTAAHCLYNNHGKARRWYDGVVFVPSFNSAGLGDTPLGAWRARKLWVPKKWRTHSYSSELLPHDVGLVRVADQGGRRLERVTGPGLPPLRTPRGRSLTGLTLLGYPAELGYSGDDMFRCLADAGETGAPGSGMLMTRNCQIVGGHSGGPAVYGGAVAGVASSSNPYHSSHGFTLIARLTPHRLTGIDRMAARAR
jgi:V8-like Glu-specific endopeptidase